jgi:hypothetical protein
MAGWSDYERWRIRHCGEHCRRCHRSGLGRLVVRGSGYFSWWEMGGRARDGNSGCGGATLRHRSDSKEVGTTQQNHWNERGRATSVAKSDSRGRPHRSVLALITPRATSAPRHSVPFVATKHLSASATSSPANPISSAPTFSTSSGRFVSC